MAKRRVKKRTHVGATLPKNTVKANDGAPRSMVIRVGAGEVGSSVSQLVKDMRSVMEPGTATRLKERKSNKLRDYTTMAGPLGVTHLMLFSKSSSGNTNLRIAKTPRGPTMHFRVEKYSLCKDIQRAQKHPRTGGHEYHMPPLLVMNNFTSSQTSTSAENPIPKHLESLTTTMFQSLFPPISPQATPLTSIRRVLLLNREPSPDDSNSYVLNLRHYAITTKTVTKDMPKSLRRLNNSVKDKKKRGLPNLGKLEDAADYLLDPDAGGGYTSASDSEVETDAEVEVLETTRKVLNRKDKQRAAAERQGGGAGGSAGARGNVERKAVKLVELGPRMKLRLQKVEEGLCGGKVMWHEHITKTAEEVRAMDKKWDQRRQEKEERRRIQKENVEKKKKEKKARGEDVDEDDEEEDYDEDMSDAWDSEGLDDEGAGDVEEDEDEDMEDDE
ncbi:ribosome biogenesis protein ssf2 [Diplodia corticola]|uniref:Ribosome biogenesis protein ssf2 n=1 Tax=Diplodia corticola TaxID=236234 RepID=A0A1J9RGV7_9PEZI|nr:ribosome biogenesis protein ssf2 [Diplodia corticola]OJD39832.1 ribosome biogenesis protein ssf2 [Diplodia corticola]